MICLYAADESLFEHNGLGILDNDLKKCHVEEVLNNLYTLTAQYPLLAKFGKSIRNGMIIKAPTPNGDQLFRIYQSKPSMGMLEIHAFHIFYDLAFNFVEDTNIVSKSGQAWLQQLSQNTQYSHPFTFFSDISTVAGSRVVRKNCVEILLNTSLDNSFVNRFGGEILRDNFNVYFNRAIGENRGFKIRHKKNLKGYTANIDDKSVITRIMPIGFDGLLLPEKYVDSPRISDYPFPRISKVEVDVKAAVGENTDAKDAIPLNEAYTKMRALIKEQFGVIDVPTCSYEVDFVELSKTKEYADFQNLETVRIGDTVTVSHDEDGFYVEAKVIRYEYDSLAGRLLRIEAGQFESRSSNNSINQQRSIEQQLEDVKIETSNMVQVAANGKNTIYRGVDRPTNANVGDLWYEPLENSVVLKQWSGVDWELIPISDQNLGNVNVNNLSGNYIDVRRFRISSGDRDILYVNEAGEVILNAKRIQIDFTDVATKTDLQEIELTPGPQGADGVGIQSTVSTYGLSANETTQPASWSASVPTLVKGQYLWTKNVWTYTDGRTETGYTKTYIPKDGNNGTNGIAGKDGVGITSTVITYARSTSGTSAPTSGWTSAVPTVPPGEFLWTKTVWNYSDNTNETGYSVAKMGNTGPKGDSGQDGLPGADGVGIQSTVSTYGLSANETTQPASWSASVPTLVKGQYLWTKNVWTYTDGRTETGYTKTYIPKDGNNGTNGIAGKDGVGITSTVITYARSTSGTSAPTSGWTSAVPTVPPGEFLWTKTVWNYSDNTNETGYSVAKMGNTGPKGDSGQDGLPGADGVGIQSTVSTYGLSANETTQPASWSASVPTLVKGQYLWTKNVWTYTDGRTETGYTKTYIPKDGNNGTNGIAGKDGVGITSTVITYARSTSGTSAPTSGWTSAVPTVPPGEFLWTKTVWNYSDNTNETGYSVAKMGNTGPKGDSGQDGLPGADGVGIQSTVSTYGLSANETTQPASWSASVPTLVKGHYLWTKNVWTYTDGRTETGYTKTYIPKDGNNGTNGIAGKDGVGISSTTITYASSSSGTTAPTSGWTASVLNVAPGQYLWTRTIWNYSDQTSETGYSVARIGADGTGLANVTNFYLASSQSEGITVNTTHRNYAEDYDFSRGMWDYSQGDDSTKNWNTSDGIYTLTTTTNTWHQFQIHSESGSRLGGRLDSTALLELEVGETYTLSVEVKVNSGSPNFWLEVRDNGLSNYNAVVTHIGGSSTNMTATSEWVRYSVTGTIKPNSDFGHRRIILGYNEIGSISFRKVELTRSAEYVNAGPALEDSGWTTTPQQISYAKRFLWDYRIELYTDGTIKAIEPAVIGVCGEKGDQGIPGDKGADGKTQYTHIAYADNETGAGFSQTDQTKAYIGMYQDFIATNSTNPVSYKWTKWKGSDGAQGIPGPKGADGKTPYIHFAYSDNADGTGLTTSDNGQRYIGHYSDYTQADSTDKTKYRWADRWAKIEIGGRNLIRGSSEMIIGSGRWQDGTFRKSGTGTIKTINISNPPVPNVTKGIEVEIASANECGIAQDALFLPKGTYTFSVWVKGPTGATGRIDTFNGSGSKSKVFSLTGGWDKVTVTNTSTVDETKNISYVYLINSPGYPAKMHLTAPKLETGIVPTGWTRASEDVEVLIDSKADQELTQQQLNLLIEKAQLMQTELEAKVAMETLSDLERAYNAYVEANDKAVKKSEAELIEAGRRVDAMVETLGGLSKTKKFIDTYIKEAEEGIIIGTNDNVSQIRVTYDRIAMYSAGEEVMYISQGVIHIDNGVFTKTLQIGRFRTEQHQTNLDINVCRYVG